MATIDLTYATAAAFPMKSSASATSSNRWSGISAVFTPTPLTVDYPPDIINPKINVYEQYV